MNADFILSSTEHKEFQTRRFCWIQKRVVYLGPKKNAPHSEGLVVKIDPPVNGQKYGRGDKDIEYLLLFCRHKEATLLPFISEWPLHVFIFRIIDQSIIDSGLIERDDMIELWAWGEIEQLR